MSTVCTHVRMLAGGVVHLVVFAVDVRQLQLRCTASELLSLLEGAFALQHCSLLCSVCLALTAAQTRMIYTVIECSTET